MRGFFLFLFFVVKISVTYIRESIYSERSVCMSTSPVGKQESETPQHDL